ncbi:MAG TPA: DUF4124 domain-containing protein [Cellvibrio sp.]|nr:DUF4124 domain-containing protein [Cellvibrio sp.]
MKYLCSLTFIIFCLGSSQGAFAKIYKWVDEKGIPHYGEQPPLNQSNKEVIKIKSSNRDLEESNVASATLSSSAASSQGAAPQQTQVRVPDRERCETAKKNQGVLATTGRIKVMGDDGEYRYLSPEELKQKADEANQAIKESCE